MNANFHTHTYRCHHASGTEREYIEKAIDAGLKVLGFSDHAPYIFKDGHYSGFRMHPEELAGYVQTLSALREEYKKDIEIRIGLEIEYYPTLFEDTLKFICSQGVEYLLLGQHYAMGEFPGELYSARESSDPKRLQAYVDNVLQGAETGLFSYVAHPDIINFTGDEEFFESELDRLVKGILKQNLPLEINLLGLAEGRNYPSHRFFKILEKNNATVILGSDAHKPENVYNAELIESAIKLTRHYHLNLTENVDLTRLSSLTC